MTYSHEVETMCPVAQGVAHGAAPIPEEAKWVKAKEIKDISGFTPVSAGAHLNRVHASSALTSRRALFKRLLLKQ